MSALAATLVLILAVDASAPDEGCDGWRRVFLGQLASMRSKYPVLAEFDPKLHVFNVDDPVNWRISFDHLSQRRRDLIRGARRSYLKERHVLRGVDALNIDIEFFADGIVGDLQTLRIFAGQRCGYHYEVDVQGADAALAWQLRTDILAILKGHVTPGATSAAKPESNRLPAGKRNAFTCGFKGSSDDARWKSALDGNPRTGWCPRANDEDRTFTVSFCEPIVVSQLRVVTARGVMKFEPGSRKTEIRLDDLVIPLAPISSKSEESTTVSPAQGQQVQHMAVRLAKAAEGGDRCLLELVVDQQPAASAIGTGAARPGSPRRANHPSDDRDHD